MGVSHCCCPWDVGRSSTSSPAPLFASVCNVPWPFPHHQDRRHLQTHMATTSNPLCLMQYPQPPHEHWQRLRGAAEMGGQSQCLAPPLFPSPWWEVGSGLPSTCTSGDGANTCSGCPRCKLAPVWRGG